MVKLDVLLKADLENVTELRLAENTRWYFTISHEGDEKEIYLVPLEKLEIPGSRGEACLVMGNRETKRAATVSFVRSAPYNAEDSGKFKVIGVFECRNCELVSFLPRSGWSCRSAVSEKLFDDIDLSEKDWAEYDDQANESMTIYSVETKLARSKEK
eukprot:RCo037474